MLIKGVVFDLDDTLISEKEYIKSGFIEVAKKIFKDHKINTEYIYKLLQVEFNISAKNVFNRVLDILNIDYDKEYILELIHTYRSHIPEIKLYEDAKYIIENLYNNKDVKLGIITDGYAITQRNKLKVLDIYKYFELIIVTDELGKEYWKPHKKSYEMMKEALNIEYENMVYVGDNVSKDFVTANKLGIHTILINRSEGVYTDLEVDIEYKAKLEIQNLKEINSIVNKLGEDRNEENTICNYG